MLVIMNKLYIWYKPTCHLKLQTKHRNMDAYIIIMHLKKLFNMINEAERYETFMKLLCHKIIKGFICEYSSFIYD